MPVRARNRQTDVQIADLKIILNHSSVSKYVFAPPAGCSPASFYVNSIQNDPIINSHYKRELIILFISQSQIKNSRHKREL